MPIVLADTSRVVLNRQYVRKSLRDSVGIEKVAVPATPRRIEVEETEIKEPTTVLSHVNNISPKKGISSYRQDLLTSQK